MPRLLRRSLKLNRDTLRMHVDLGFGVSSAHGKPQDSRAHGDGGNVFLGGVGRLGSQGSGV